ncbi:hypothetical protein ZWY2020_005779 [Hordeum vulgare]|nr:hypothetical protein ZWY2020_005779 [Hordeum vulgare]
MRFMADEEVFAKIRLIPISHGDPAVDVGAIVAEGRAEDDRPKPASFAKTSSSLFALVKNVVLSSNIGYKSRSTPIELPRPKFSCTVHSDFPVKVSFAEKLYARLIQTSSNCAWTFDCAHGFAAMMNCSMDNLPEALVTEILKRITRICDLNSFSLVSKQLYKIEGGQRDAIRVGSGLCTATKALKSLCARFPNLRKVEIDYSGWIPGHRKQLHNKGLSVLSSHCSSLIDLTLSFCSRIDDSGLACLAYCKTLVSLRLNSAPKITSVIWSMSPRTMLTADVYDFCCEGLKDLRLAHVQIWPEAGLRVLLGKCKALEKVFLKYARGLNDNDMTALSRSCSNLKSISLWLNSTDVPYCETRTPFTDTSPQLRRARFVFWWLVLNNANFFDDDGMKALSCSLHLETLELILYHAVTDAGMCFIVHAPCLSSLTLRACHNVTDVRVAKLGRAQKLESLVIEYCGGVSPQAGQGVAKSVHYSRDCSNALMRNVVLATIDEVISKIFSMNLLLNLLSCSVCIIGQGCASSGPDSPL